MSGEIVPTTLAGIAQWAFLIVGVIFAVTSVILDYHWSRYEIEKARTRRIRGVYFGVSAAFLIIIAALFFNLPS